MIFCTWLMLIMCPLSNVCRYKCYCFSLEDSNLKSVGQLCLWAINQAGYSRTIDLITHSVVYLTSAFSHYAESIAPSACMNTRSVEVEMSSHGCPPLESGPPGPSVCSLHPPPPPPPPPPPRPSAEIAAIPGPPLLWTVPTPGVLSQVVYQAPIKKDIP